MRKELSLIKQILGHLREFNCWISGAELEDFGRQNGYKASTAGRRCREMEECGMIKKRVVGGFVQYHHKEISPMPQPKFTPHARPERIERQLMLL